MPAFQDTVILKTGIEIITPERAAEALEKAKGRSIADITAENRRIRGNPSEKYAKDMKDGNWKLTHQGIAFTIDGFLIDGQHRLTACVESGVPLKTVVSYYAVGTTPSHLPVDLQIRRTTADVLHQPQEVIEIVRYILREFVSTGASRLEVEISNFLEANQDAISMFFADFYVKKTPVISRVALRAAVFVAFLAGKDWRHEYTVMGEGDINAMEPDTRTLWQDFTSFKADTKRVSDWLFGVMFSFIVRGPQKVWKDATVKNAWEQARAVLTPYLNYEIQRQVAG